MKDGVLLFVISSFVPEIFTISYYANEITGDVINCYNVVPKQKMTNISGNNWEMQLKLGTSIVQSNPGNSNLQGKKKMVRVIGSSSYRELRTNDQK